MTRLSSRFTVVSKWGLPLGWFAFFIVFFAASAVDAQAAYTTVLGALAIAIGGFLLMRLLVSDLADSVLDGGTYLQVRRSGVETQIPFQDIVDVSAPKHSRPPRVVLRLARASPLGSTISFLPDTAFTLNPFARNAVALRLLERALASRATNAT